MIYWASDYYPILKPLPVGHEIHWKAVFTGKDQFIPEVPDPTLESAITVARGLGNGAHSLTLKRNGPAAISAIRIFNPLARKQPPRLIPPMIASTVHQADAVSLQVTATGRYILESSSDCKIWQPVTAPVTASALDLPIQEGPRFFRARALD